MTTNKAKLRAAEKFAKLTAENTKIKKAEERVVREKEEAQKERAAKTARLKALRLAKDEQGTEPVEETSPSAAELTEKLIRRSRPHRRQS